MFLLSKDTEGIGVVNCCRAVLGMAPHLTVVKIFLHTAELMTVFNSIFFVAAMPFLTGGGIIYDHCLPLENPFTNIE